MPILYTDKKLQIPGKISYLIHLLIFIISFSLTSEEISNRNLARNITSFKYFLSLKLHSGTILFATDNYLYILEDDFDLKKTFSDFSDKLINNIYEIENIFLVQYDEDQNNYFIVKINNLYYLYERSGSIETSFTLNLFEEKNNIVIAYLHNTEQINNTSKESYEFFTVHNDNFTNIVVYHYKIYFEKTEAILISSYKTPIIESNCEQSLTKNKNITCQYMKNYNKKNILVCFYEINNNKLVASIFDPNNGLKKIKDIYKISRESIFLKSVVSDDRNTSFVCYMTLYGSVYCSEFSNNYQWGEDLFIFNNSIVQYYSFYLFYDFGKKCYIIKSQIDNNKIQIVILSNNFQNLLSSDVFCLVQIEFENCIYNYVSEIIYDTNKKKYLVLYTCSDSENNDIFEQKEMIINCTEIRDYIIPNTTYSTKTLNVSNCNYTEIIDNSTNSNNKTINIKNETNTTIDDIVIFHYDKNQGFIMGETNKTKEEIIKNLNRIIDIIEIGKIYEIIGEDFVIKIHPLNSKLNENSTNVYILECEDILREKYGLSSSSILTIMQIEIKSSNENSLTNQVQYAIYDENKNQLNLSYCENVQIKIDYGIKNNSILNTSLLNSFSDQGIDILNSKDDFFNDICYPYSTNDSKTDIILEDRINDIYQNYSICDSNCTYKKINMTTNIITCSCQIKTNITYSNEEEVNFGKIVINSFKNANFQVLKCYKLIFSSKGISKNVGFYFLLILTIIHIPFIINYLIKGISPIKLFIFKEMKQKNFLFTVGNPKNKSVFHYRQKIEDDSEIQNGSQTNNNIDSNITNLVSNKKMKKNNTMMYYERSTKSFPGKIFIKKSSVLGISKINSKRKKNFGNGSSSVFSIKNSVYDKSHTKKSKNSSMDNTKDKNSSSNIFYSKKVLFEEKNCPGYYNLILINGNRVNKKRPPESKYILTNYNYNEAVKYDDRSFWRILLICLYYKVSILHTFFFKSDLEMKSLRISLFIFSYALFFSLNALFYGNSKISDRYHYKGDSLYLFSIINNMTISLSSTFVSLGLIISMRMLINSNKKFENLFREKERKLKETKSIITRDEQKEIVTEVIRILHKLNIKIRIFIIIEFILMLFFTYYISAFCAVFKETQSSWFSDSIITFVITNIIEILISFIIALLYMAALQYQIKILYKISMFIYNLGH